MTCPARGDVVVVVPGLIDALHGCDLTGVTLRLYYSEPPMDPTIEPVMPAPTLPAPVLPMDSPEGIGIPAAQAPDLSAQVAAPEAPIDLSQLSGLADGNPVLLFGLAALLVVGGGAGWKFWTRMSEQRHEQAMAKLAAEREMAGLNGAQPPPCQTHAAQVEKQLGALEKRHADLARKVGMLLRADGPSLEELDERIVKLEKARRAQK